MPQGLWPEPGCPRANQTERKNYLLGDLLTIQRQTYPRSFQHPYCTDIAFCMKKAVLASKAHAGIFTMKKKCKPQIYKPSHCDEDIARDLIEAIDRFLEIRRLAKCARTVCVHAKHCRRPRNCASTYRSGEQACD